LNYISQLEDFLKILNTKTETNDWERKSLRDNKWISELNFGVPHGITGILLFTFD
jgi:hypothetical protein